MATAAEGFYLDRQANHCTGGDFGLLPEVCGCAAGLARGAWHHRPGGSDRGPHPGLAGWSCKAGKLADWTVHHHAAGGAGLFQLLR